MRNEQQTDQVSSREEAAERRKFTSKLTPQTALTFGWVAWFALSAAPVLFLVAAIHLSLRARGVQTSSPAAVHWFWGNMLFLAVVVPASFFWRAHLFRSYRRGGLVPPATYLLGMLSIWVPLALAGILAACAAIAVRTMLPNIVPAALALGLFWFTWPTGHAMTLRVGGVDDAELYEEAR